MLPTLWTWPSNISKFEYAPAWNWLHETAISYSVNPGRVERDNMAYRIYHFVSNIPCVECRGHALRYWTLHPPDLENSYALQAWAWRFHNTVNQRLGKKIVSYEEYQALFADELRMTGGGNW